MQNTNDSFWNLLFSYRRYYIAAVGFAQLAFLSSYMIPIIIKNLIDGIFAGESVEISGIANFFITFAGGKDFLAAHLWVTTMAVLILTVSNAFFIHFTIRFSSIASENIIRTLRNRLYAKFQNLPDSFFSRSETGDLLQRCTSDIRTIRAFLSAQLYESGRVAVMILMLIPVMFIINVKMAMLSLITFPFIAVVVFVYLRILVRISISMEKKEGKLTTVIQENLTGIRVVRAFARQAFEREKFAWASQAFKDAVLRQQRKFADFFSFASMLAFIQTGIVLIFGAWMVTNNRISLGTLVAFITYTTMVVFNFRALGVILSEIGGTVVAISRIDKILQEPEMIEEVSLNDHCLMDGGIRFDKVSFSYTDNNRALKNVSFKINAGETVAIVGPTGSGKTSIIKLLLKNYNCQEGTILLGNKDLRALNSRMVRSQIGTSLQEAFLFSTTIKSNIKIAKDGVTDEEMITAAKTASIHETVQGFIKGYDSQIGERGIKLSGGQRQRVAMARSFVKRPLVLILDDSLSAVDTRTEGQIVQAIENKHENVTTIVITHRLSCCVNADRILVLENGELVAQGRHKQLIKEKGFYRRLWEIQKGIEKEIFKEKVHE